MRAVVVIPSVAERLMQREETVSQWQRLGIRPRIALTPADLPRSPTTHGLVCRQAIRQAHRDHPDRPIILCEDDVTLSSLLGGELDRLQEISRGEGKVITLYLPGRQFYPARIRRLIERQRDFPLLLARVRDLRHWFGSQCLILPPRVAAAMDELEGTDGFDGLLRAWLLVRREDMLATVPNLAQHRSPPSVTSRRYRPHWSVSYRG